MPDAQEGIRLQALVGGILRALREAKHFGDMESSRLMEVYKKEPALSSFTVPSFTVSDVDVELRFSIMNRTEEKERGGEMSDIKVDISPASLKGMEAHQVSVMKLKISPVSLKVFEE